ncbi:polysaccharide biosynthesis/export family protein [Pseudotenacibaculum haliotis]|uniref:Polysaccharide biosynthesis/export family protein n=1 Tax=Pseudotenacibaculum haliotis TaxID=1862138 RepID=A0ABW5LTZ3_9FLAO
MLKKIFILSIISSFILSSCVSKKKITYFQNDEIDQSLVSNNYKTIFKPDDLLQIVISAQELETVRPFNLPVVTFDVTTARATGIPQQQMYLIDSKGEIDFPILGKLKIGGLTREQVIELFKKKLDPEYVKNPTINIRIANFKITVSGDVRLPGTYTIPNERITIAEAIGLAGDLNISGQRYNVKVIREEGNQKKVYTVDLLSNKTFTSPVYYLEQNDLIYVEPNNAKAQSAATNQNTGLFVSIGSIIISLIAVLTR